MLVIPVTVPTDHPHDCEVSETRLAVLGDQNVVLGALNISVRVHSILHFAYRVNTAV